MHELLDQMMGTSCLLAFEDMIFLAERCHLQRANRELHNKLMLAFNTIDFQDVSLAKVKQVVDTLFPSASNNDERPRVPAFVQGRLDKAQFVERFLFAFYNSSLNMQSAEDLKLTLDYLEFLDRYNPLSLQRHSAVANTFGSNAIRLNELVHVPLEDQVRVALLYLDKAVRPHFFFPEILRNRRESFGADVSPGLLNEFIDKIIQRADAAETLFEHMRRLSGQGRPRRRMSEMSIRMLRAIVRQIMEHQDRQMKSSGTQSLEDRLRNL